MHLGRARLAQHPHDGALGVAADDRVVDDHKALALDDVAQRVQLQPDAQLPDGLRGLDEGAPDVGVLDQALRERDAAGLRVPDRGGRPGLGRRDDQVGLDGVLAEQRAADLHAGGVHAAVRDPGVRPGQVDELEQAALRLGGGEPVALQPALVDGDHLAGLDLAHEGRTDDVQGCGLRGHDPAAALQPADHQRADALRVPGCVERVVVHEDQAEGPAHVRQLVDSSRQHRLALVGGQQRGEQLGVGGGVHQGAQRQGAGPGLGVRDPDRELVGVGQVAVVAQCQVAGGGGAEGRLGVLPDAGPGRGVAAVADGHVTLQGGEDALGEDLRDQAHLLVDHDLVAVADGHAGRLLAPVLQRVEAEVGELGDLLVARPHPEDAARVLRPLIVGVELVGEHPIAARHG